MSIFVIPTGPEPFRRQRVLLDGTNYIFHFNYNQRGDFWMLDVNDENDNPIVQGVKLVANYPLLKQFANIGLPPGLLVVVSNTTDDSPPGYADLGTDNGQRCSLVYYDQAELKAAL